MSSTRPSKPKPWRRARVIFFPLLIVALMAPAALFIGSGLPDRFAWLVMAPGWLITVPIAAWGAIRITERLYARHAPVFDWPSFRRECDMGVEALCDLIGGVIALALGLLVMGGLFALVAAFPVPLAIIVGAIIIANAVRG